MHIHLFEAEKHTTDTHTHITHAYAHTQTQSERAHEKFSGAGDESNTRPQAPQNTFNKRKT